MGAVICAVFVLCAFAQLIFGTPLAEGQNLTACYQASSGSGAGGGLLGGAVAYGISGILGTVGAYLVLIVLFIICAVVITERSFVTFLKKGGSRACQYAKEDFDRRKELHAERMQERVRLREEQKVRGVNLGATILDAEPEPTDGCEDLSDDFQNGEPDDELDLFRNGADGEVVTARLVEAEGAEVGLVLSADPVRHDGLLRGSGRGSNTGIPVFRGCCPLPEKSLERTRVKNPSSRREKSTNVELL